MTPEGQGRGSDQFPLRLPDGMRHRIKEAARANGRSMNSEIVARLEEPRLPSEEIRFLDAISDDPACKARALATLHHAVAMKVGATDVLFVSPALGARIAAVTGDEYKVHDAAKAAIEAAFPAEGITWAELLEDLRGGNPVLLADRLEHQIKSVPGLAERRAL